MIKFFKLFILSIFEGSVHLLLHLINMTRQMLQLLWSQPKKIMKFFLTKYGAPAKQQQQVELSKPPSAKTTVFTIHCVSSKLPIRFQTEKAPFFEANTNLLKNCLLYYLGKTISLKIC